VANSVARREVQIAELQKALATIYTPANPIDDPKLFSGRSELLAELRSDLTVVGSHLVLYGERGVGKTSLWSVLLCDRKVARHSASELDDFVSIFLRVLEGLGEEFTENERKQLAEVSSSIGLEKVASASSTLSTEAVEKPVAQRSLDLNFVLDRVARRAGDLDAIVIDEFQNIRMADVQTQIIEVVKGFTDRNVRVTIVMVGVADSDDELLSSREYEQYKGRHFFARRVPRMPEDELRDILERRERTYEVKFDEDVKTAIVSIASGYPGTAHRLALLAAQAWATRAFLGHAASALLAVLRVFGVGKALSVEKANVHVEQQDLRRAVERFIGDFREHHAALTIRYDQLIASPTWRDVERVISTLASSPTARIDTDELARITGLTEDDLARVLDIEAPELVQRVNGSCRLAVRQLRAFIEANRYLAT
jgi:hypothetical protein